MKALKPLATIWMVLKSWNEGIKGYVMEEEHEKRDVKNCGKKSKERDGEYKDFLC